MSRRKFRRTLTQLLIAVPAVPLLGCEPQNCDGSKIERSYNYSDIILTDGTHPTTSTPCEEACAAADPLWELGGKSCEHGKDFWGHQEVQCIMRDVCVGRRPEGLLGELTGEAMSTLGALYARVAWLEAAAVPAFERLAQELAAYGAPKELVQAALRSARDEIRHARLMGALARRHGAVVPRMEHEPFHPRSLEALALENAVEGCVRETYGALVAAWQARHAAAPEVRRALQSISSDELRHSELSWEVDAWVSSRMPPAERARLQEARHEALHALAAEVEEGAPTQEMIRLAGLPSREAARHLVQGLTRVVLGGELAAC
jgi:hypothetical protein